MRLMQLFIFLILTTTTMEGFWFYKDSLKNRHEKWEMIAIGSKPTS